MPLCDITSIKLLEKLIQSKGDFSKIPDSYVNLESLKDWVKKILDSGKKTQSIDLIVQKMIDLEWDINEMDHWIKYWNWKKIPFKHSLFYASYVTENTELTYKLIDLGCKLFSDTMGSGDIVMAFIHAVATNDVPFIAKLMSLGFDINSSDITKDLLCMACMKDSSDAVRFLLENGATVLLQCRTKIFLANNCYLDQESDNVIEMNAVMTACSSRSFKTLRVIHSQDPYIFKDNSVSWPAFALAIKGNNNAVIDLLIELGGDINVVESKYKRNLFMIACKYGKIDIMKYVFGKGNFDINAVDALGNTALFYSFTASSENNLKLVKFLIAMGADLLATTRENLTALHLACLGNLYDVAKYLLTKSAFSHIDLKRVQPAQYGLIQSALGMDRENMPKTIRHLFEKGADINEKNLKGEVAFSFAKECSSETLSFLLSQGADVNSIDSRGMNCLQSIMESRDVSTVDKRVVQLLINHGINLNWGNEQGNTVMHFSCMKPFHIDVIELLLGAGARTDIPNNEG